MIFVGVRYSFGAGFSMEVENFYIEKGLAESASFALMSSRASSSVVAVML